MTKTSSGRTLCPAVYPDGSVVLEWTDADPAPGAERIALESRIWSLFSNQKLDKLYWLLVLGTAGGRPGLAPALEFFRLFAVLFARELRLRSSKPARTRPVFPAGEAEELLFSLPPFPGGERVDADLLSRLWTGLWDAFQSGYKPSLGSVDEYLSSISPTASHSDRVHFHLVENREDDARPFAFLATYSAVDPQSGRIRQYPLSRALHEFAADHKKLLSLLTAVRRVAKESILIKELLDSGELFHALGFTVKEAYRFLDQVELFENAGILCRVPKWWNRRTGAFNVNLTVGGVRTKVGAEALLDASVSLTMDGEPLTAEEIDAILEETEPLVLLKGRWVAVDRRSLSRTRERFLQAKALAEKKGLSIREALKLILEQKVSAPGRDLELEISAGAWLRTVLDKLKDPVRITGRPLPRGLKATLRPYQVQGVHWLRFLSELGFGGCLADDMGLGKTVQMIAYLLDRKETGAGRPHLIVVPTSLIENWKAELERFAPGLRYGVLHGSGWSAAEARENLPGVDLLITTYGMTARTPWLAETAFDCVVLDEAQAVKNSGTAQARAVKKLNGEKRFLMTGTPVENRLTDLWSLFDFANPGLLGTAAEFKAYCKQAETAPERYGRLRQAVSPYILRRLKTDRSIIDDLPEKTECKTYAELSKKQAVLYEHLVQKLERDLETAVGPAKRGIVLGYLIKFKQLCNHPDHYAGGREYAAADSGKFERLRELCAKIHEEREKILVFTQFTEIVEPLSDLLEDVFGSRGVSLTGAMSVAERKAAVRRFQEDRSVGSFVLSVRAGGTGLNLTAANHVIHFDRWWNPAVENQATDRAFRIGQKKNVLVHKFITAGTVEEKIDRLIEEKRELADGVVGTAESAITSMTDGEIVSMFTFGFK